MRFMKGIFIPGYLQNLEEIFVVLDLGNGKLSIFCILIVQVWDISTKKVWMSDILGLLFC